MNVWWALLVVALWAGAGFGLAVVIGRGLARADQADAFDLADSLGIVVDPDGRHDHYDWMSDNTRRVMVGYVEAMYMRDLERRNGRLP